MEVTDEKTVETSDASNLPAVDASPSLSSTESSADESPFDSTLDRGGFRGPESEEKYTDPKHERLLTDLKKEVEEAERSAHLARLAFEFAQKNPELADYLAGFAYDKGLNEGRKTGAPPNTPQTSDADTNKNNVGQTIGFTYPTKKTAE